jgi:hypothetical protein
MYMVTAVFSDLLIDHAIIGTCLWATLRSSFAHCVVICGIGRHSTDDGDEQEKNCAELHDVCVVSIVRRNSYANLVDG